uniref:Uncharacterized protein n=1 Tax=Arundo donax TaxID=35708 RepID=A0A0A9BS90_ARUDO
MHHKCASSTISWSTSWAHGAAPLKTQLFLCFDNHHASRITTMLCLLNTWRFGT